MHIEISIMTMATIEKNWNNEAGITSYFSGKNNLKVSSYCSRNRLSLNLGQSSAKTAIQGRRSCR